MATSGPDATTLDVEDNNDLEADEDDPYGQVQVRDVVSVRLTTAHPPEN